MKTLFLTGITCLALAGCSSVSIHDSSVTLGDGSSLIDRDISTAGVTVENPPAKEEG